METPELNKGGNGTERDRETGAEIAGGHCRNQLRAGVGSMYRESPVTRSISQLTYYDGALRLGRFVCNPEEKSYGGREATEQSTAKLHARRPSARNQIRTLFDIQAGQVSDCIRTQWPGFEIKHLPGTWTARPNPTQLLRTALIE